MGHLSAKIIPSGSEKTDAGEVKTTEVEPAAVAARILI